jgi:hypothetical protein
VSQTLCINIIEPSGKIERSGERQPGVVMPFVPDNDAGYGSDAVGAPPSVEQTQQTQSERRGTGLIFIIAGCAGRAAPSR